MNDRCPDCRCELGEFHGINCQKEECPVCNDFLFKGGCQITNCKCDLSLNEIVNRIPFGYEKNHNQLCQEFLTQPLPYVEPPEPPKPLEQKVSFVKPDFGWRFLKENVNNIRQADIWFALIHMVCERLAVRSLDDNRIRQIANEEFTKLHLIEYIDIDEVIKYIQENFR